MTCPEKMWSLFVLASYTRAAVVFYDYGVNESLHCGTANTTKSPMVD